MKAEASSATAAWIAVARGLGRTLPADEQLIEDPFGELFSNSWLDRVRRLTRFALVRALLRPVLLVVQLRTRLIDGALVDFVRAGGRQVVLLGAGFDARAWRFADALAHCTVVEVDHPATQQAKRAGLEAPANLRFLPWDFLQRPAAELPAALQALGLDPALPTLTVWEGVTMYLNAAAVDASTRAIAAWSAPGSSFVWTYFDAALTRRPGLVGRLLKRLLRGAGEEITFGLAPAEVAGFLADRGFSLKHDVALPEAARLLLPPAAAALVVDRTQRVVFSLRSQVDT